MAVAVAGILLARLIAGSNGGRAWGELTVVRAVALREQRWPGLTLAGELVKPTMVLVAIAVSLVIGLRRGPFRALGVFVGIAALANITVQAMKLVPAWNLGPFAAVDPLSGHVGVTAGVGLALVVIAPARWRWLVATAVAFGIAATSAGVVLAGWHDVAQVLCPLAVCAGFAVAGCAALSRRSRPDASTLRTERALAFGMTGVGLAASLMLLPVGSSLAASSAPATAMTLALCTAMGVSVLAVGGTWLAAVLTPQLLDRAPHVVAGQRFDKQLSANHD
jgi:hypothetical protein